MTVISSSVNAKGGIPNPPSTPKSNSWVIAVAVCVPLAVLSTQQFI